MNGIASQADVEAIEAGQRTLPASTYEMIAASAAAQPGAPALSFFMRAQDHTHPEVLDYASLFRRITATANFFGALGIGKDDVVAFALPNLPETHLTIWGGEAAGIVLAINPMLEPAAIAGLLAAARAKVFVCVTPAPGFDLWPRLQPEIAADSSLRHVVLIDITRRAGSPAPCPLAGTQVPAHTGSESGSLLIHDFDQGLRAHPDDRLLSGRVFQSSDLSSFFCTGGTTGTPKIAMRTHGNEVANAWSCGQVLGKRANGARTIFCGLPLFHVNAVSVTGLQAFAAGDHVILGTPQGYRGEGVIVRFWEIVERHRINSFSGVPTLYGSLLQQAVGGRDISSLEYGICGAAPMPRELIRSFQQATGLKILEGYGLTEGTCVSTINPPRGEQRFGSIGLRVPLQRIKVVMLDEKGTYVRDCHADETGVIAISGANVFTGYLVDRHNQDLWLDLRDGLLWLNTGDLGRQDAEGYVYLTGRRKELIIRGGHNIDPASIEEPLHAHPAVQLAAAVGRPDVHAGELPVAYVQLKAGAAATEQELLAFAQEHIHERAALPKWIRIIPNMPLTAVGKIFKPALRQREIADALRAALDEAGVGEVNLAVTDDPQRGTCIDVAVPSEGDRDRIAEVLGRFSFTVRLSGIA